MPEKELYNNKISSDFPFKLVSSKVRLKLAAILQKFEKEDAPHANFVAILNLVLVWTGARTACLPSWEYCGKKHIDASIRYLNKVSQAIRKRRRHVQDLVVLYRPQIYRSGDVVEQGIVVRRRNPRVRFTPDPPINDAEIGRELDMYPPNADHFGGGHHLGECFSIWEAGSDALLYAEAWSKALLSDAQLQEFRAHCEKRVALWNAAMENFGLKYRYYGTMDWKRSEVPWSEAAKTYSLFGKPYLGADRRGGDYYHPISKKAQLDSPQSKPVDCPLSQRE